MAMFTWLIRFIRRLNHCQWQRNKWLNLKICYFLLSNYADRQINLIANKKSKMDDTDMSNFQKENVREIIERENG